MKKDQALNLSKRERQIMEIIYRRGNASAMDVLEDLVDKPNYSTVRALLRILEEKGQVRHEAKGQKYIFYPVISKDSAVKSAVKNLLSTFFNNSAEEAIAALLEIEKTKITDNDFERISDIIEKARKEEKDE